MGTSCFTWNSNSVCQFWPIHTQTHSENWAGHLASPHLTSPHPSPTAQPTKPNQWELGTRKHYKTPCQPRCWHLISCLCLCLPPRLVSLHPTSTRRPHPSAWLWKRCLWIWKWENVRNFRNPSSLTLSLLPPTPNQPLTVRCKPPLPY